MLEKRVREIVVVLVLCLVFVGRESQAQNDSGFVSITSNIDDANIYCDSLFIGTTPLPDVSLPAGKHSITVIDGTLFQWNAPRKDREIDISGGASMIVHVDFPADSAKDLRHGVTLQHDILIEPRRVESHPLLVSGGAVALISGIATAYYKIQADNRYDKFLATGDRQLLDETHRYDTMAAVTLALSQVGLVIVAYYLLSE